MGWVDLITAGHGDFFGELPPHLTHALDAVGPARIATAVLRRAGRPTRRPVGHLTFYEVVKSLPEIVVNCGNWDMPFHGESDSAGKACM